MVTSQSEILVESRKSDALVRAITRRLPNLAARIVIRLHRLFVGRRLTPIAIGNSVKMAVSPQDNLGHNLFYFGSYEPNERRLWEEMLSEGNDLVVVDVGANVGYYSLLAASRPNVARVVSFEPNPMVLPVLEYNVAANPALQSKITVAAVAAGDAEGGVPFHRNFAEHNFGLGSLRAQTEDEATIDVPLVRLDRFLPKIGVSKRILGIRSANHGH
jgi:FkbM family methyltransferase